PQGALHGLVKLGQAQARQGGARCCARGRDIACRRLWIGARKGRGRWWSDVGIPALQQTAQALVQALAGTAAAVQHMLQAVLATRHGPLRPAALGAPDDAADEPGPALPFK